MEMGLYGGKPLPDSAYAEQVRAMFPSDAAAILARYPRKAYGSASEALATVWTDALWARPALDSSRALAKHVPTYAYEFAETGGPWFRQTPTTSYPMGAFHTAELPYLFAMGHFEDLPAGQQPLADTLIGYWTRFAHTGDPNGGGAPKWQPCSAGRQTVQSLTATQTGPVDFAQDHRYPFWTSLNG
ncbi:hypothetical protein Pa4123_88580 [Phytohabitans aurantiacus]|uniref:Carboxylesterase type B domain-containing protein n=2 Tax=Phytohabitans aurantiacus TaxID=3016789 RepID=A0ABQ5RB05_9ACTN|nr:hypothetical protein Pa4123_88580 [Phytohabitans aurantiacus]